MPRNTRFNLIVVLAASLSVQGFFAFGADAQQAQWSHAIDGLEHIEAISGGHFLLLNAKGAYRVLDAKSGEVWMSAEKQQNEFPFYPGTKPETLIIGNDHQYEVFDLAEKKSLGAGAIFSKFECYPLSDELFLFQFYNISQLTGVRQNLNILCVHRANGKTAWAVMSFELPLLNAVLSADKSTTYLLTAERIDAIKNADGSKLWEAKIPSAVVKPASHGGEVFEHGGAVFVTQEGLTKIDAATGKVTWSEKYPVLTLAGGRSTDILAGTNAPPLFTADAVITSGKGKIRKFDLATGKKLWESKEFKAVPAMKLEGERLVFITGGVFRTTPGPGCSGMPVCWNALPNLTADGSLLKLDGGVVAEGKPGIGALNTATGVQEFLVEGSKQSAGIHERDGGWILADALTIQRVGTNGTAETLKDLKGLGIGEIVALVEMGTDWVLCGKEGVVKINLDSSNPAWTCVLKKFRLIGVTGKSVIGISDKDFTVVDASSGTVTLQVKVPDNQWTVSVEGKFLAMNQNGQVQLYAFE